MEAGKRLLAGKFYDEALRVFDSLHAANPGRASFLLWRCQALAGAGRMEEAQAAAEQAAKLDPYNPAALLRIAQLHLQAKRRSEAMRVVRSALKRFPDDARLLRTVVTILGQRRRFALALTLVDAALERNPFEEFFELKASVLLAMEEFEQLKQFLLGIGRSAARQPGLLRAQATMHAALGDEEAALKVELQLVAQEEAPGDASKRAAQRLYRLGRYQEATQLLDRTLASAPTDTTSMNFRIASLHALGDTSREREAAFTLASHAPDDAAAQYKLSHAYFAAGEIDRAKQAFERFVDLTSRRLPPTLAEGLARLRANPQCSVDPARLAWAWRNCAAPGVDRKEWENAARFGVASSRLISDWVYCARDRLDELNALFLPLEDHARNALYGRNRGGVLIGAHLGVVMAAVHYFQTYPTRLKIGTTGPIAQFFGELGQNFFDFEKRLAVRDMVRAANDGHLVGMVADNPHSLNTIQAALPDGRRVRLMRRIPRVIWKHRADSVYCFALWEGERIRMHVDTFTPSPEEGEPYPEWEARWVNAYLDKLMSIMRGAPENLRLSGGLWENF